MQEEFNQLTELNIEDINVLENSLLIEDLLQLGSKVAEGVNHLSDTDKSFEGHETNTFSSPPISFESMGSFEYNPLYEFNKPEYSNENLTGDANTDGETVEVETLDTRRTDPFKGDDANKLPSRSGPKRGRQRAKVDKKYLCHFCQIDYHSRSHLKRHDDACHKNIRPYTCMRCWSGFKRKDHAGQHARRKRPCKAPSNLASRSFPAA